MTVIVVTILFLGAFVWYPKLKKTKKMRSIYYTWSLVYSSRVPKVISYYDIASFPSSVYHPRLFTM